MNGDDWARIKALFNAALDEPPHARVAFVAHAAGADTALRHAVESLLASHEDDEFLEVPAAAVSGDLLDALPPGGRAGRYRLLREIGRGGMGTVHLAVRDDGEFRQQVAVKLVKRGMDTDLILRRFRNERQILAELDHPNIGRLLDGGTTDDGRPFFVMEHIEGEPIDAYCARLSLSVDDRLRLFRPVCDAVQHAHRNLIVHRDIKSSNILVTSAGVPKLLDFGIAKLLGDGPESSETHAPPTMRALTPDYASPEQVRGDPITTASDVYSLGVLLYELLARKRPYHLQSIRPEEIARSVCEVDPVPPSRAVEGAGADDLARRLRGDLDTIVMMAMQKDPRRRYGSVDQLSDDIGRHLDRRPVAARRDTLRYRAAKFTRRNRAGVIAGSIVLLSLIAGLATTVWQARVAQSERARAERRFAEVRTLATSFLFELHDAIATLPGSTAARALLVRRALASLDGLAREAQGDPTLQRELASAYERIGRVQGNSYNSNLGDAKGALESYRKSMEIRERLARDEPPTPKSLDELAAGHQGLGDMLSTIGDLAGALKEYQQSLAIRRALLAADPGNTEHRRALAELFGSIGDTQGMEGYANLGDVPGALDSYRQAVRLREELLASAPQNRAYRTGLAHSLMNLGYLAASVGDPSGPDQVRQAVDLLERVVAEDPNDADRQLELLAGYVRVRQVLADVGRLDEAISVDRETIAALQRMIAADPANSLYRRNLGVTYNYLGRDQRASGQAAQAAASHRKALAISQKLVAENAGNAEHRHDVATGHYLLADALADARDDRAALEEYRQAARTKEQLLLTEPTNVRHGDDLALVYTGMARTLTHAGELGAAHEIMGRAIPRAEAAVARNPSSVKANVNLALTYAAAGKLHAARAGTAPRGTRDAQRREARWRDALASYEHSLQIWRGLEGRGRLPVVQAGQIAQVRAEIGRCEDALGLHAQPEGTRGK